MQRLYPEGFRQGAIDLVRSGRCVVDVARELAITSRDLPNLVLATVSN